MSIKNRKMKAKSTIEENNCPNLSSAYMYMNNYLPFSLDWRSAFCTNGSEYDACITNTNKAGKCRYVGRLCADILRGDVLSDTDFYYSDKVDKKCPENSSCLLACIPNENTAPLELCINESNYLFSKVTDDVLSDDGTITEYRYSCIPDGTDKCCSGNDPKCECKKLDLFYDRGYCEASSVCSSSVSD